MLKGAEKNFDEFEDTTNKAEVVGSPVLDLDCPPCLVGSGASSRRQCSAQDLEQEECFHNSTGSTSYCPNKHLGCEWTGNLTDVVEHMNCECECSPVSLLLDENVEMPMIIMMRGFEQLKRNNESWYSPVFCTHEKGYHFRLKVDANGWCGTGDAVAVVGIYSEG